MHATGLVLVVCAVGYWIHLQGTPAYVAMRGARALFEDASAARGLPWQADEARALGYDDEKAFETLKMVRSEFTAGAEIVDGGEFLKVTGKDAYIVKVRTKSGDVVDVPIVVIDQAGRGVIQLGDLILAARVFYFEEQKRGKGASEDVLNPFSEKLTALGIEGYYDVPFNRIEPWKKYDASGAEAIASN
jgi:hypothetical protein